jgi:hypothetical protein
MKFSRRLLAGLTACALSLAPAVSPASAASGINAAELFARACLNNVGKHRPVEALARSEKWLKADMAGAIPAGMPRPSRLKVWIVDEGKTPVVIVTSTMKVGGVNIDGCTVSGPATRGAINRALGPFKAKVAGTFNGQGTTVKIYDAERAGDTMAVLVQAIPGGYNLSVMNTPD